MKKKQLKALALNKAQIANFNPNSLKGGSVYTSYELPNGEIICKYTYHPGCNPLDETISEVICK